MAAVVLPVSVSASKFRGCMIGGLVGDCLGYPFEDMGGMSKRDVSDFITNLMSGHNHKYSSFVRHSFIPSTEILPYTDDTSMALSIASSLVEKGALDAKDVAKKFVAAYYRIQPERGYGIHVRHVFKVLRDTNFKDVFLPARLQFGGSGSYGNGAAMRTAPIALFGNMKGESYIMSATEECARITHTHINGINGAILQSLAVNTALEMDSSENLDPVNFISKLHEKMESVEMKDKEKPYCESLNTMKEIFLQEQEDISSKEIAELLGNEISALRSVPTAIYSFLRGMKPLKDYKNDNPFLRTVYFAISLGGDTDTIACMAGNIAGAYYSADIIPETLQKRCEEIDEVIKLADKLFNISKEK